MTVSPLESFILHVYTFLSHPYVRFPLLELLRDVALPGLMFCFFIFYFLVCFCCIWVTFHHSNLSFFGEVSFSPSSLHQGLSLLRPEAPPGPSNSCWKPQVAGLAPVLSGSVGGRPSKLGLPPLSTGDFIHLHCFKNQIHVEKYKIYFSGSDHPFF